MRSRWTTHLAHLGYALKQAGIGWLQLDGSMNREKRNEVIEAFQARSGPPVLMLR